MYNIDNEKLLTRCKVYKLAEDSKYYIVSNKDCSQDFTNENLSHKQEALTCNDAFAFYNIAILILFPLDFNYNAVVRVKSWLKYKDHKKPAED